MIDEKHVEAAFARFRDFLEVGAAHGTNQEAANERGAQMWQSVGLTEAVRLSIYDHATTYLGPFVCPESLLFGALFGLMAAAEAGELPTVERDWDADFARLLGG